MSFMKDWFKTKYKIVPVYTQKNEICGYTVLSKVAIGWMQTQVYRVTDTGLFLKDSLFNAYEDALTFLKHETTTLTDEKISDTERD